MNKKQARIKRAMKSRYKIFDLAIKRLVVYRSVKHIYAQIIDESGSKVITQISTISKSISDNNINFDNKIDAAKFIGSEIAKLALALGIDKVAFDRSGFKYHGRIKALADSAREQGLKF